RSARMRPEPAAIAAERSHCVESQDNIAGSSLVRDPNQRVPDPPCGRSGTLGHGKDSLPDSLSAPNVRSIDWCVNAGMAFVLDVATRAVRRLDRAPRPPSQDSLPVFPPTIRSQTSWPQY